jgi:hypothetical protein
MIFIVVLRENIDWNEIEDVSFHENFAIWVEMSKNRGGGERGF